MSTVNRLAGSSANAADFYPLDTSYPPESPLIKLSCAKMTHLSGNLRKWESFFESKKENKINPEQVFQIQDEKVIDLQEGKDYVVIPVKDDSHRLR